MTSKKVKKFQQVSFSFDVPIKSSFVMEKLGDGTEYKKMLISGEAIHECVTSNGHEFLAEELRLSASSLSNRPLLKDHINSVDAIVGRTKECVFNEAQKCVDFNAFVTDPDVQKKIDMGLIDSVSIGANVKELEYDDERDIYIARGIYFRELSLVAVGADERAGFTKAMEIACSAKLKAEEEEEETEQESSTEEEKANQTQEQTETAAQEKESAGENVDEEEVTMSDTKDLEAQNAQLLQEKNAMEAKLKQVEARELDAKRSEYVKLATEKGITPVDVSKMERSVIEALISQVSSIQTAKVEEKKTEEKKVEEKPEYKGVSDKKENKVIENGDSYFLAQSELGGSAMFRSHTVAAKGSVFHRD